MTEELKPCPAGHLQEFLSALNGGMGDLDAWLECNNEDEVRIAIHGVITAESAEVERLREENAKLRTVMIAAAEEIAAHWDAHCDDAGCGPLNLMCRLEYGIPTEYGYKAGDFERLREENRRLLAEVINEPEELCKKS